MTRPTPGYFGIGIYHPKRSVNIGTMWRSAAALGASFTFEIGSRYNMEQSDTARSYRIVPHFEFDTFESMTVPYDCKIIGVELDPRATMVKSFNHSARAIYLMGAEDTGLPGDILDQCDSIVQIDSAFCLNVACAASIIMHDRTIKSDHLIS